MTSAITRSGSLKLNKAITPLETIKYAQEVVNEAEQVKTAEGRLHESIESEAGYEWHCCLEKVFITGEMPPEGNFPYPRGYYDAESRGSEGSIGAFSEEELLYKTLDLTAIKVYVNLMRRGETRDKDLLEGIKGVKFSPAYIKNVMLNSEKVLDRIREGIKGHVGRLLSGEGSSRSGYMLSEPEGDLRKSKPPVTRAGSAQLRKAGGAPRGGKYTSRKLVGGKWVYTYPEEGTKKLTAPSEETTSELRNLISQSVGRMSKIKDSLRFGELPGAGQERRELFGGERGKLKKELKMLEVARGVWLDKKLSKEEQVKKIKNLGVTVKKYTPKKSQFDANDLIKAAKA